MTAERGGPKYSLRGLLTLRRGDLDAARVEASKARDAVEQAAAESQKIGNAISETERELRALLVAGAAIDPARHTALSRYLTDRRQEMKAKLVELRKAEQAYEQSRKQLHRVKQGVMVLEKHQEAKRVEYRTEATRREQQQMDDLWLQQPRQK